MGRAELAYLHVRAAIEQGRYPQGSALPTQPALARTIGVSTVTLRQALDRLAEEGFVEARQGHGTFVRSRQAVLGPVLVVDDESSIRELLVEALEQLGYEVEAVASGDAAVERASHRHFSHVLLDVRMSGMDGLAAGDMIARIDPRTVIVFVTAYPIDLLEGDQAGHWPALVLRKPFDLDKLERALQLKVH